MAMLLQRRTRAELEAMLAERLAELSADLARLAEQIGGGDAAAV